MNRNLILLFNGLDAHFGTVTAPVCGYSLPVDLEAHKLDQLVDSKNVIHFLDQPAVYLSVPC